MKKIWIGALFLMMVGGLGGLAVHFAYFTLIPAKTGITPEQEPVIVEIHKGVSPRDLSAMLRSKGVITHSRYFFWLGRFGHFWNKVKAGEYQVSPGMTPLEVFSVITSGISINHPVTVREGENMFEVAADIESKGLSPKEKVIELCRSPQFMTSLGFQPPMPVSLEGYLFPDTYFFNKTMSAEDMVRQMVKHFFGIWTRELAARAQALGMSRHQVVTLASIIEKETGAPLERPLISSVFHNRLKKRMRLQSDPTTIYGMWERYKGNIHKADLQDASPYNTYYVPALPIGPISNPGKEAIQAALFPAESDYLFFVSHNDGTHEFTRSYGEHTSAVRKFQVDPKAREGKSWRDLQKKKVTK